MLKPTTKKPATDWQERARVTYESIRRRSGTDVLTEEPLPFHAAPRDNYHIKNPCPFCNPTGERGGRMFYSWNPHDRQTYVACLCCSRRIPEIEYWKLETERCLTILSCGYPAYAYMITMLEQKATVNALGEAVRA